MPKTVIHLFHGDDDSVVTGSRVAQRILEVAPERGLELEVFCFGPAQRRIGCTSTKAGSTFNGQLDQLISAGITVGACVNSALADDSHDGLMARGISLEVARDAFVRFTLEGATVISF